MPRTLHELLQRYHADREPEWSHHHTRIQRGLRDFWLLALGTDAQLSGVTPAGVQNMVAAKAKAKDWTPRSRQKYLRYIVDAFTYAQRKLKWIDEAGNLSAVTMPKPGGQSRAYSIKEVRALLRHGRNVDPRVDAMLWLAWTTGRRLAAIRQLPADAVERDGGRWVVVFGSSTDKARRSGRAYLGRRTAARIRLLLRSPLVRASGLLFPAGDLGTTAKPYRVVRDREARDWLRAVERLAEVETRRLRGFHGVKRRFASSATDKAAAEKQSGTNRATLARVYEQDDPAAKIAEAERLESLAAVE